MLRVACCVLSQLPSRSPYFVRGLEREGKERGTRCWCRPALHLNRGLPRERVYDLSRVLGSNGCRVVARPKITVNKVSIAGNRKPAGCCLLIVPYLESQFRAAGKKR